MSVIQVLLDSHPGPLPITGTFQAKGDMVPTVFLSGTAQAKVPNTGCQVQLQIYDQDHQYGGFTTAAVFSNEAAQHKTLLSLFTNQKPFAFGVTYTYMVSVEDPTTTADANDFFSLTIVY